MSKVTPIVGDIEDLEFSEAVNGFSLYLVGVQEGFSFFPSCYVVERNEHDALDSAADEGYLDGQLLNVDSLSDEEWAEIDDGTTPTINLGNDGGYYHSEGIYVREIHLPEDFQEKAMAAVSTLIESILEKNA